MPYYYLTDEVFDGIHRIELTEKPGAGKTILLPPIQAENYAQAAGYFQFRLGEQGHLDTMCYTCTGIVHTHDDKFINCKEDSPMKKYTIEYRETYAHVYTVEADSYEAAVEKLNYDITNGEVDGPEDCIDSSYQLLENDKED